MPPKGFRTVNVQEKVYEHLKAEHEKSAASGRSGNIDFTIRPGFVAWTSMLLEEALIRVEVMRRYGPFLEERGVNQDQASIWDNRINKMVDVKVRNGELLCLEDARKDCVHVGFAWSIPMIYKVMKLKGARTPDHFT